MTTDQGTERLLVHFSKTSVDELMPWAASCIDTLMQHAGAQAELTEAEGLKVRRRPQSLQITRLIQLIVSASHLYYIYCTILQEI